MALNFALDALIEVKQATRKEAVREPQTKGIQARHLEIHDDALLVKHKTTLRDGVDFLASHHIVRLLLLVGESTENKWENFSHHSAMQCV